MSKRIGENEGSLTGKVRVPVPFLEIQKVAVSRQTTSKIVTFGGEIQCLDLSMKGKLPMDKSSVDLDLLQIDSSTPASNTARLCCPWKLWTGDPSNDVFSGSATE